MKLGIRSFGIVLAASFLFVSSAEAQSDPARGYFESGPTCSYCGYANDHFWWDFYSWDSWYPYLQPEQTPCVFYSFPNQSYRVAGMEWYPSWNWDWRGGAYNVDYNDEGWSSDVVSTQNPSVEWQQYVYIPAMGDAWARFSDKWTNTSGAAVSADLTFNGYMMMTNDMNDTLTNVLTSDGDDRVENTDTWLVVDDDIGSGQPAIGIVWEGEGGEESVDTAQVNDWGWGQWYLTLTFTGVSIDAGATATVVVYAIQAETMDEAAVIVQDLASGSDSEMMDVGGVEDSLVNFVPGDPNGPRLIPGGPYRCDEGGSVQLGVSAIDRDGNGSVTWSWDFNNDGTFGDQANVADPVIDCTDADGTMSMRIGIRLTDNEGIVEDRHVSVGVNNVAPVITSTPGTDATTNEEYRYQITVTDIPADTFTYELDEAPPGMTVSGSGLLRWTPPANGIGPTILVQLLVTDDDGGEAEQVWNITMHGGPVVTPGGPYVVAEGDEIPLAITAFDPEDPNNPDAVAFAWDLDSDGVFDDSTESSVVWSAAGIDGPAEGFVVHVVVSDGEYDIQADIPIEVRNAPPEFVSVPSSTATIAREWRYVVQAIDPGDDPFEFTVDEEDMPIGMTFDPITATFVWTPNQGHLLQGEPPGHYAFRITAQDEDRGRSNQDVSITIVENAAPPVPPIKYPNGPDPVHTPNPTIILDNVDDPDGDVVQYFLQVDSDPCFCGPEVQASGALVEGPLVTQWAIPRPFNVDTNANGHTRFYVRRWTSDGLAQSAQELSMFDYEPPEPDGDADADSDGDVDGDSDGDSDCDPDVDPDCKPDTGCATCRTAPTRDADTAGLFGVSLLLGLFAIRRRRRA